MQRKTRRGPANDAWSGGGDGATARLRPVDLPRTLIYKNARALGPKRGTISCDISV
jgi:hypothetical protein